jgi:hypothetical protein
MGLNTKTYWLTDRQSQCDFDFEPTVQLEEWWIISVVWSEAESVQSKMVIREMLWQVV